VTPSLSIISSSLTLENQFYVSNLAISSSTVTFNSSFVPIVVSGCFSITNSTLIIVPQLSSSGTFTIPLLNVSHSNCTASFDNVHISVNSPCASSYSEMQGVNVIFSLTCPTPSSGDGAVNITLIEVLVGVGVIIIIVIFVAIYTLSQKDQDLLLRFETI